HYLAVKGKLESPKRLYWTYHGMGIYYAVAHTILMPLVISLNSHLFHSIIDICSMTMLLGPGAYTVVQLFHLLRILKARHYSTHQKSHDPKSCANSRPLSRRLQGDHSLNLRRSHTEVNANANANANASANANANASTESGRIFVSITREVSHPVGGHHMNGGKGLAAMRSRPSSPDDANAAVWTPRLPNSNPEDDSNPRGSSPIRISSTENNDFGINRDSFVRDTRTPINLMGSERRGFTSGRKGGEIELEGKTSITAKRTFMAKKREKDEKRLRDIKKVVYVTATLAILSFSLICFQSISGFETRKMSEVHREKSQQYSFVDDSGWWGMLLILAWVVNQNRVDINLQFACT
ncbi:hypothetical protein AAMO2058_000721200, partial [Amorphochlora amoebiformis]